METIACDLCGSTRHEVLFTQTDLVHHVTTESFTMVRCECGLVFLNPRPTKSEIGQYYSKQGYSFHKGQNRFKHVVRDFFRGTIQTAYLDPHPPLIKRWLARALLIPLRMTTKTQKMLVQNILPRPKSFLTDMVPGRFLDIGCGAGIDVHYFGTGESLRTLAKKGWDTHGIEPSAEARQSLNKMGINTHDDLLPAQLPAESFDVIRMNWSLEHVHSIAETLTECRRLLKPSGRLIVGVPNYDGITYKLFPACVEIPIHLFYLTPETLRTYATKTGLDIVDSYTFSYVSLFLTSLNLMGHAVADNDFQKALSLQTFLGLVSELGQGDDMVFCLKKS